MMQMLFNSMETEQFQAMEPQSPPHCSDNDMCVIVKNTFIDLARSSGDATPSLRRAKTFPLCCDYETSEGSDATSEIDAFDMEDSWEDVINTPMTEVEDMADLMAFERYQYLEAPLQNVVLACKEPAPMCSWNTLPLWQAMYTPQPNEALPQIAMPCKPVAPVAESTDMPSSTEQESDCSNQPQEQHRLSCSHTDGSFEVIWHVEKRWLSSESRLITSPSFVISFGSGLPEASCKLVLHAQGSTFKKSRGHGHFDIKCESVLPEASSCVSASFSIGTGLKEQPARGPVFHSFAESATCGLPTDENDWYLRGAVNKQTKTVPLRVQITPMAHDE